MFFNPNVLVPYILLVRAGLLTWTLEIEYQHDV